MSPCVNNAAKPNGFWSVPIQQYWHQMEQIADIGNKEMFPLLWHHISFIRRHGSISIPTLCAISSPSPFSPPPLWRPVDYTIIYCDFHQNTIQESCLKVKIALGVSLCYGVIPCYGVSLCYGVSFELPSPACVVSTERVKFWESEKLFWQMITLDL